MDRDDAKLLPGLVKDLWPLWWVARGTKLRTRADERRGQDEREGNDLSHVILPMTAYHVGRSRATRASLPRWPMICDCARALDRFREYKIHGKNNSSSMTGNSI